MFYQCQPLREERQNNLLAYMRQKTTFGAIMVNLGRQWVFSEIFLLDVYGGLGYAFKNEAIEENIFNDSNRFYGVIAGDRNPSLAISGGFRIGILLQ